MPLKASDFDYNLPEELIAQKPASKRDRSRLMVMHRSSEEIEHTIFNKITDYLKPSDVLVLNDTKVMPARLYGVKYGGGEEGKGAKVEVLLSRRIKEKVWEVIARPAKRLKMNTVVQFSDGLFAEVVDQTPYGARILHFACIGDLDKVLQKVGKLPLPPYVKVDRTSDELAKRYQTIYAKKSGATAAPTAGLHFTDGLLKAIKKKGVEVEYVTLHTGLGTFQPVRAEYLKDHKMHSEEFQIDKGVIERIGRAKKEGRRIVAVGTTVVRLLESMNGAPRTKGETDLFITPGYKFKMVDAMITNFHLPKSTLVMLVSAFAGSEFVKKAYSEAVKEKYRFFSFGDATLIV
ncbi:tRNA preQ1(34) S-adenosylmethionine ribosyltransferase-isomerase QueA [Candidatus Margulisiibacteriota bacterium]